MTEPCIAPKPGLTGAKIYRCRCDGCRAAARNHANKRTRLVAYGRWQPFVDAETARRHIRVLQAAGIGLKRIADLSGVSQGVISRIMYGTSRRPQTKRVRPETETRLLAVKADGLPPIGSTLIDGTGTRRRIGALAAIGWSLTRQAAQLGRLAGNYARTATDIAPVQAATADAVAVLYRRLRNTPAPPSGSATAARRWAVRNGWEPPAAWDESTIDDPEAVPYGDLPEVGEIVDWIAVELALKGQPVNLTRLERLYAVHAGRERGWAYTRIADALRMSVSRAKELGAKPLPDDCEVAA